MTCYNKVLIITSIKFLCSCTVDFYNFKLVGLSLQPEGLARLGTFPWSGVTFRAPLGWTRVLQITDRAKSN